MMHVFSPQEWEALWAVLDTHKAKDLGTYAVLVNETKARWMRDYPGVRFDNKRYECHLEQALKAGATVPAEYLAVVTEDDLRFDYPCFPSLIAATGVFQERLAAYNRRLTEDR